MPSGPHPPPWLIDQLLDALVRQTSFRCIQTYGVLNGLGYIFAAARARGLKVIATLFLNDDPVVNQASIALGAQRANEYRDTIVRVSCGSEVGNRLSAAVAEPIIRDYLTKLRAAGVTQPLTSIDTWWNWCNETRPCRPWALEGDVDWIGINVFLWWENRFSGLFPARRRTPPRPSIWRAFRG